MLTQNRMERERGASLVEAALSVGLVAAITIAAIAQYGSSLRTKIQGEVVVSLGGKVEAKTGGTSMIDPGSPLMTTGGPTVIKSGTSSGFQTK